MKKQNNKKDLKKRLFSFKKPLFIITTIIMTFILVVFGLWIAGKCTIKPNETYDNTTNSTSIKHGTLEVVEPENIGDPIGIKKKDANGNYTNEYKVSIMGDLHLNDCKNSSYKNLSLNCVEAYIKLEHPDLVILNGDTLDEHSWESSAYKLINMFERNNQYWSFALGNHDNEHLEDAGVEYNESRIKTFELLSGYNKTTKKYAPHCLARLPKEGRERYGLNNVINLLEGNGKIVKSLILTDSSNKIDPTPWYNEVIDSCSDNNVLITHIPFNEYAYACNNIGKDKDVVYHYGTNKETIADILNTSNIWNAILEKGKTKDVIFAHDHQNNISLSYKGIKMTEGLGFAFNMYTRRTRTSQTLRQFAYMIDCNLCEYIEGATNLYIKPNEMVLGNSYAQFNGIFDNLKNKLYLASLGAITYNARGLTIFNRIIYPLATVGCLTYYGFLINYHVNDKKKKK